MTSRRKRHELNSTNLNHKYNQITISTFPTKSAVHIYILFYMRTCTELLAENVEDKLSTDLYFAFHFVINIS